MGIPTCVRTLIIRFIHTVYEPLTLLLPGLRGEELHGIPTGGMDEIDRKRLNQAMDLIKRSCPQSYHRIRTHIAQVIKSPLPAVKSQRFHKASGSRYFVLFERHQRVDGKHLAAEMAARALLVNLRRRGFFSGKRPYNAYWRCYNRVLTKLENADS